MKKIKDFFATPKKAIITSVCLVAGAGVLAIGIPVAAGAVARGTGIGATGAEDVALKDAGTDFSQARVYHTNFDFEDGHYIYEVQFTANGTEYEYQIQSSNGKILGRSTEPMPGYVADTNQTAGTAQAQQPAAASAGQTSDQSADAATNAVTISIEDAKRIALDHAGLSEDSVKHLNAYLEYDDGIEQYEVQFYDGTTEYDYTIDAVNGTILEYGMESIFS